MPSFFNSWFPFIYLYVGGAIFLLAGLIIIRKSKALDMRLRRHRFWWKILIAGYVYYLAIHAFLIIAALYL